MSRTFRRLGIGDRVIFDSMEKVDDFVVNDEGKLCRVIFGIDMPIPWIHRRGSTPEEHCTRSNMRFFTDNYTGHSAPKSFRRVVHRRERRQVKLDLHESLSRYGEEGFVDIRHKLPYWN